MMLSFAVLLFAMYFDSLFVWLHEKLSVRFTGLIDKVYEGSEFTEVVYSMLSNVKRSILLFGLAFFGILMAYRFRIRASLLSFYFIVLVVIDLGMANLVEPVIRNGSMTAEVPSVRQILKDQPPRLFRILASPHSAYFQDFQWGRSPSREFISLKNRLAPDFMMIYKLYDCMGYDSIHLLDVSDVQRMISMLRPHQKKEPVLSRDFQLDGALLDMLNVKYYSSTHPDLPVNFKKILTFRDGSMYENTESLPRAFLVENYIFEKENQIIFKHIFSKDFNPTKTVYINEKPEAVSPHGVSKLSETDSVSILDYEPESVKMHVNVGPADRWLFLSDTYYPGWKALVDGKETKIYKANGAFRAIHLTSGNHEVVWSYDPVLFKIGSAVTLCTLLGLFVYYLKRRNVLV